VIRRGAFNFATAISLLLCAVTVGLWVRSYFRQDCLQWSHTRWAIVARSNYGELAFDWMPAFGGDMGEGWGIDDGDPAERTDLSGMMLGFGRIFNPAYDFQGRLLGQGPSYWFPHWAPALLFGLLPGYWIVSRIRRRGIARPGHCSRCGYNLTANTSGVCPECGTTNLLAHGITT
jgi:hypothetical protein